MHPLDDTITAIASAPGGAARGIVRLSGPAVDECLQACFHRTVGTTVALSPRHVPSPKGGSATATPSKDSPYILEGELRLQEIAAPLPCEVYLWPAGHSYTGQRVAEFHTIGSPPLLDSLLKTLSTAGARSAEPGEFTLRAFLSGRIDLTQAEAVLGVIDATDDRQLQTALGQLAGGLAGPLHKLRGDLLELLAHLEAGFDFAEEDISFITAEELDEQLSTAAEQTAALLDKMSSRNVVEQAVKAVLLGRPNAGKSSLFNALLKKSGALVSATPGTTRDYLTAELDLDGVKCQLIDTAGVEGRREDNRTSEIDSAAQAATSKQHQQSAFRMLCLDATQKPGEWEQLQIESGDPETLIIVLTKIDQLVGQVSNLSDVGQISNLSSDYIVQVREGEAPAKQESGLTEIIQSLFSTRQVGNLSYVVATSSATGEGLDLLRKELRQKILSLAGGDAVSCTAARCRQSLVTAQECLHHAAALHRQMAGEEFVAGEIRLALEELGRVVGAVYTDDVLDRIFSRFCVGK